MDTAGQDEYKGNTCTFYFCSTVIGGVLIAFVVVVVVVQR
jgi:hypothetical protein